MDSSKSFGANLKRERLKAGLSQEDLAHLAGLHPTEISRLERAARDPRLSTITRLARALKLEVSTLLHGV